MYAPRAKMTQKQMTLAQLASDDPTHRFSNLYSLLHSGTVGYTMLRTQCFLGQAAIRQALMERQGIILNIIMRSKWQALPKN